MALVSADLKFFGSQFPNDTPFGGGRMTGATVQHGVENNVFPDVTPSDRVAGRVQRRKIFAAVTAANTDTLASAQVAICIAPTDPGVNVALVAGVGEQGLVSAVAPARKIPANGVLSTVFFSAPSAGFVTTSTATAAGLTAESPVRIEISTSLAPRAGSRLRLIFTRAGGGFFYYFGYVSVLTDMGGGLSRITPSPALPADYPILVDNTVVTEAGISLGREDRFGSVRTTVAVAAGATYVSVSRVLFNNTLQFRAGDLVLIGDQTTFELKVVSFVDYRGGLEFTTPLANAYASGKTVGGILSIGTLQPLVGPSFEQQTWTRVWADGIIGSAIDARYNRGAGTIAVTSMGALTERWAVIFTSTTTFKVIGERVGAVGTGSITAAFSPNNPLRGSPYFTIPAAGWGTGWAIGNVMRFNTTGTYADFVEEREVLAGSSPAGLTGATAMIFGSIDA